jgi:hypothetical protein
MRFWHCLFVQVEFFGGSLVGGLGVWSGLVAMIGGVRDRVVGKMNDWVVFGWSICVLIQRVRR